MSELLKLIPEEVFVQTARDTQPDYYAKALKGKMVFNMLFYGVLTIDKLGRRGLADVLSSPLFRLLFNVETEKESLSPGSVSERLSKFDVDFFEQVYKYIPKEFSRLYPAPGIADLQLQRAAGSPVAETSGKPKEGMACGNEYKKKKPLKYTLDYDVCIRKKNMPANRWRCRRSILRGSFRTDEIQPRLTLRRAFAGKPEVGRR